MTDPRFAALRRRLVLAGGHPSHATLEGVASRRDEPGFRPARLLEPPLRAIAVGEPSPWREPVAFLDGVQHSSILGHVGTAPLVVARIAAGVRRRVDRVTRGLVAREQLLVLGRPAALGALGELPGDPLVIPIDSDLPPHPVGDLEHAHALIDRARTALEIAAATAFRVTDPDCWLIVDGSLTASPDWSGDPRMIGVVKSHAALPFDGGDLETYLTLPVGHRSSAFAPETRHVTPVHSWALRLWEWSGHDLLHGLVRIETAAREPIAAGADRLARHLLAERAPLADDLRRDRLLYGIHDVERWLRARSA